MGKIVPLTVYTADGQRREIGYADVEYDGTFKAIVTDQEAADYMADLKEPMKHFSIGPSQVLDLEVSWVPEQKEVLNATRGQ